MALQDLEKARNPEIKFPLFMALFDFGDICEMTGLHVVDMREFACKLDSDNMLDNRTSWCTGSGQQIEKKMVPACDQSEKLDFAGVVPEFNRICGTDQRVATIGSSFPMPNPNGMECDLATCFGRQLTPSRNMMLLMKRMLSRFPSQHAGVAIWFGDKGNFHNCGSPDIQAACAKIFQRLVAQEAIANGTHESSTNFVLLSNGHALALACFRHHAQQGNCNVSVSTANYLVENDEGAQILFSKAEAEMSAVCLLLDQCLVGLADEAVFQTVQWGESAFHERIQTVHQQRGHLLEKMHRLVQQEH